jgi:hypothetical protein
LQRRPASEGVTWYALPVTRAEMERQRELEVVVRRMDGGAAAGTAPQVCAGQEDPHRPGAGGASRWEGQRWISSAFGPTPNKPESAKRPVAQRYYVELRLYDEQGAPRPGVWF